MDEDNWPDDWAAMVGDRVEGDEENSKRLLRRRIVLRQLYINRSVCAALALLYVLAIAIRDTSSQESDDECSSYYSSVVSPDESYKDPEPASRSGDTYYMRMQRVHLWRDSVAKDIISSSHSLPLKRKMSAYYDDDDNSSPSPSKPSKRPCTTSRPSGYMCSACNVPFLSQQSLHQHEACRAAVASVSI